MKRIVCIVMTLALLLAWTSVQAEEQTELVVWCWGATSNGYAIEEAAKLYNEENPNVKITWVDYTANDLEAKLTSALAAGETATLPDILLLKDLSARKFLYTFPGSFASVDDVLNKDQFASFKLNHGTVDGVCYCVPFDNGSAGMFVRTDYLKEAGYTADDLMDITWDQYIEIGKKVKEVTGKYMLAVTSGYVDPSLGAIQSAGTWYFDSQGKPNIRDNAAIRAWVETVQKLHDSGIVYEASDWSGYVGALNDGSAAGTYQGNWIINTLKQAKDQSGKWAMCNVPSLAVEGATNYTNQGGSNWYIPATGKNVDLAKDFLVKTFGSSVKFYETILEAGVGLGSYLPAAESPLYQQEDPFFANDKVFARAMEYSTHIPSVEYGMYNNEARNAIVSAIEAVIAGGDIDEAIATAAETVDFLMEE